MHSDFTAPCWPGILSPDTDLCPGGDPGFRLVPELVYLCWWEPHQLGQLSLGSSLDLPLVEAVCWESVKRRVCRLSLWWPERGGS